MCGIFAYHGNKTNAAQIVLSGIKSLEYRGYDSWGIAAITATTSQPNKIVIKKQVGKIGNATVKGLPSYSNLAFGHTRWATHGGVTQVNAHPHLSCNGEIAVIHNGIVENYEILKKNLLTQGHSFLSQTDTEVISHLIEEFNKTMPFNEAFQNTFQKLEGLNAIIAISKNESFILAVRNGSPLVVGFGHQENFLASDPQALLPHTNKVYFLNENEVARVSKNSVTVIDLKTNKSIKPNKQTLKWRLSESKKGSFQFYMLKEIYEQPRIIANISNTNISEIENLATIIKKSYGTYLVGCGTASYACLAGSYLFSKIAKRHVNWAIGSEFGYQLEFLTPKSLVIAISQSGETMDTLESVKKAKERGSKIFALVNVEGSTLFREADYKMLIGAGPEKAVASTKVFTAMLSYLLLLSYSLASRINFGQKILLQASVISQEFLLAQSIKRIQKLAKLLKNKEHIYATGRGLSYPASLETALKIKEISYIHAEGLAAGELKHGPLALVEKDTPCIAFLPNDETQGANLAATLEMKARGAFIIGVSHKPHEVFDEFIKVEDAHEATIIPNVIVGQLLAYYLTLECGFDPDKPRNLAKSVTVK